MPFLPLITNNLGKIAATMAAGTVGYANRKTIGRWLAGDDKQTETQACMREKAQEVRQIQGQMTLSELDRKHSELLEKLNQANAAALGEMRTLTKDVKTEVADLRKGLQGQLDTQRAETMRLGKELAEMRERQEKSDQAARVHGASAAPRASTGAPATSEGRGRSTSPRSRRGGRGHSRTAAGRSAIQPGRMEAEGLVGLPDVRPSSWLLDDDAGTGTRHGASFGGWPASPHGGGSRPPRHACTLARGAPTQRGSRLLCPLAGRLLGPKTGDSATSARIWLGRGLNFRVRR